MRGYHQWVHRATPASLTPGQTRKGWSYRGPVSAEALDGTGWHQSEAVQRGIIIIIDFPLENPTQADVVPATIPESTTFTAIAVSI